jgi:2-polyprenyl-3-methyl-5-hydroxy-6-metoxy-1,4-benzoquinol methylase
VVKVKSPLNPDSKLSLLETYPVETLINAWKTYDIDINEELRGIENINLYHCETSCLDFFTPASAAGSSELYSQLQKFDWFYMPQKWEFEEAIKDLENCKSLLEVGCGRGFFIDNVLKKLKCDVKGIEFNEEAVEKARNKKLPVENIDLKQLIGNGETFDAVCSFQVLEHTTNPRKFLESIMNVLTNDGILILSVPNKESFLKQQFNILDMPPHHMTRWNLSALRYLEKLFPIKMIRASYEPLAKYHISGYVSAYIQLVSTKLPLGRFLLSERIIRVISALLEITGMYSFLRGQSLYVVFKKTWNF